MKILDILFTVNWEVSKEYHPAKYDILDDESDEYIYIDVCGTSTLTHYLLDVIGYDVFDEEANRIIIEYIRDKGETDGEFIMVLNYHAFQSNNPMDPPEWDEIIIPIGILGSQVKLSY